MFPIRFNPWRRWWWVLIAGGPAFAVGCGIFTTVKPQPSPPANEVVRLTSEAARGYFREVAANYSQLSQEKFSSVTAAMQRNVELDSLAREHYGNALKAILQARITGPNDQLTPEAGAIFAQMSEGFARVGKEVAP
jgi:hypothetical protein